jgi:hypothetical protein
VRDRAVRYAKARAMTYWFKDDLGYFAKDGARQASVWKDGRRWAWRIFRDDGSVQCQARSRSLEEAQNNAAVMLHARDYDNAPTDPHHGGKIWNP